MKRRPTIRDVAAEAGVSRETVSRVINHKDRVAPETKARVEAAIAKLGYRPNAIARSMARGRTKTLSLIAPNLIDYTFACIVNEAEQVARRQGYVMFSSSAPDEETFKKLLDEFVASRRVDGLIVINAYNDNRYALVPENVSVVFIGGWDPEKGREVSSVNQDQEAAAILAAQHLIDLGHRRIALITGPLGEKSSQERYTGFQIALQEAGIAFDRSLVVEGDWSASTGYQAINRLWQRGQSFTAVSAHNDRMAVGVIRAARDAGVAVPEQLSVIGIDDIPLASYFDPPLTTVKQDLPGFGREAIQLLINSIRDPQLPPDHLFLPAELVVRHSTGRCPK